MTFLGLPENPAKARVIFLPAPYDATTSYLPGTRFGPRRIIEASPYLEFYDEECACEVHQKAPFLTLPEKELPVQPEKMLKCLQGQLAPHVEAGLFPVTLGGEHTVSLAPISLLKKQFGDLCVIQIDAHADLRNEYQGSRYSHACTMRRALELGVELYPVGIRAISREEIDFARQIHLKIYWARDVLKNISEVTQEILTKIRDKPVYVTIDLDGFDPAEVPGVGTPEPGGLRWYDGLFLLRKISSLNVVGFDVVELLPRDDRSAYFAARLVYKFLAYLFC